MNINKNVKNAVIGTVSESIMASSCTPYFTQQDEDSLYLESNTSFDLGGIAIPITMDISQEDRNYIVFLQKLAIDIIANPIIAKEFSKHPDLFIARYGYNETVNLDDGMLKMTVALGDEDIYRAIKANDIKLFYNLCKKKNLSNIPQKNDIGKYSNYIKTKMIEKGVINEKDLQALPWWLIGIFVAVYYGAVAAVGLETAVYYHCWQVTEVYGMVQERNIDLLMEDNPTLNIWFLKGSTDDTYYAANTFIENQIDDIIDILKEENTSVFENYNEENFRNFLKINMYK